MGASQQDALGGQPIQARARNPTMPIHPEPAASVMPVHNQQIVASPIADAHQACPNGNHKGFSAALQESVTVIPIRCVDRSQAKISQTCDVGLLRGTGGTRPATNGLTPHRSRWLPIVPYLFVHQPITLLVSRPSPAAPGSLITGPAKAGPPRSLARPAAYAIRLQIRVAAMRSAIAASRLGAGEGW